jgi:hypothetical protein
MNALSTPFAEVRAGVVQAGGGGAQGQGSVTAAGHAATPQCPVMPEHHRHGFARPGRTLAMGVVNVTPDSC